MFRHGELHGFFSKKLKRRKKGYGLKIESGLGGKMGNSVDLLCK
jgi:hypothetical protein